MDFIKFGPFADLIIVDDAETIRALAADDRIDRQFVLRPLYNGWIIGRLLRNLTYRGAHFPHLTARNDSVRKFRNDRLWRDFNARAGLMTGGSAELEDLAKWIRGEINDRELGVLVQQVIGRFFKPAFQATPETWRAALALREDAISKNLPKLLWWQLTGKAQRAKELLASTVDNNLVAMHGIAVASHNLVATMHLLRSFYADKLTRNSLTPAMAVERSLRAPNVVYRQAVAPGVVAGCPFSKFTLLLFKLQDANVGCRTKDMVFMSGTWSRCPAEQWIPAVILGTWQRVIGTAE